MKNQIGKLIEYERVKAEINLQELCRGLCSHTFLIRIEAGERACEKILADALLQRAGVSADKMVYMVSPEEQEWLLLREELFVAVEEGTRDTAERLLEEYKRLTEKKSELHHQIVLFAEAMLIYQTGKDKEHILTKLQEAWEVTSDGVPLTEAGNVYMALTELVIAMMDARIREDLGRTEEAADGYGRLLAYLEVHVDEEDRVKLYPQIAYRLAKLYLNKGEKKRAVELAEKSVALLRIRGRLFYLRQFLELLELHGKRTNREKKILREIGEALHWVYAKYEITEESWDWRLPFELTQVEIYRKLIRDRREAMDLTLEQLAENICDWGTISRIERGVRTPKRRISRKLLERVGRTGDSVEWFLQVGRPELLDLAVQINGLLSFSKGAEVEPLIDELEAKMKKPNKFTRQYLIHVKALALFNQNKINIKEYTRLQEEALFLTMPQLDEQRMAKWCFSPCEMDIINCLSYSYEKLGRTEDILRLLRLLQRQLEESSFSLKYNVIGYELTMRNLGNVLGNAGQYRVAMDASDKAIRVGLRAGRGNVVRIALYDYGWDMEQLWNDGTYTPKASLPYIKASWALDLLFGSKENHEFNEKHMKKYYGTN